MSLFEPQTAGAFNLRNRVIMSALTRARADASHTPTEIMTTYYQQRASAGLILTEATMVSENQSAFYREPAIHSEEQVAAWKKITDAVHAEGGLIVMQLWHGGRATHPDLNNGNEPVGPSAIAIEGDIHTPGGKVPYVVPRELKDEELPQIVADFRRGAENAKKAGFDGVELHGANGYLLDQFLRDGSNKREGNYGGSLENRARLLLETVDAAIEVFGADRVGVRLSPLNSFMSMKDSDPAGMTAYVAKQLDERKIAFLDLMRADFFGVQKADVVTAARENFKGSLWVGMGFDKKTAQEALDNKTADAIVFGHHFVSNPDLVERMQKDAEIVEPDQATYYTQEAEGYITYKKLEQA